MRFAESVGVLRKARSPGEIPDRLSWPHRERGEAGALKKGIMM